MLFLTFEEGEQVDKVLFGNSGLQLGGHQRTGLGGKAGGRADLPVSRKILWNPKTEVHAESRSRGEEGKSFCFI